MMTQYLTRKMDRLDIPSILEFIEMIAQPVPACTGASRRSTCSA
jgi:hypothetical protein